MYTADEVLEKVFYRLNEKIGMNIIELDKPIKKGCMTFDKISIFKNSKSVHFIAGLGKNLDTNEPYSLTIILIKLPRDFEESQEKVVKEVLERKGFAESIFTTMKSNLILNSITVPAGTSKEILDDVLVNNLVQATEEYL